MPISTKKIPFEDIRALCIKEKYFTDGSNMAYEKLADLARAGATKEVLAAVIWACSDESANLDTIIDQLEEIEYEA